MKQLLAEFDSVELSEWKAYDRLNPINHARRAEVSAGIMTAAIAAPHCSSPQKASDYMRDYAADWIEAAPEVEIAPQELSAKIDAIFGAMQ